MQRLIEFIRRIYVVLLFVLVEGVALWHYAISTPYAEAKILSRTTAVGGAVSGVVTDIGHFFSLPGENRMLTERIAVLEQTLERERELYSADVLDAEQVAALNMDNIHYRYYPSRVTSITTNRQRNFVVLDKGVDDGIKPNMGVITPDRKLVGYIIFCSRHYSVALPVLSTDFNIGGRLVENRSACSVRWRGGSPHHVEIFDLSTYAAPKEGMAVEVSSERLPDGVLIGHIESFEHNATQTAYSARLRLATDLSSLDNVLIVENTHYGEIEQLLKDAESRSKTSK